MGQVFIINSKSKRRDLGSGWCDWEKSNYMVPIVPTYLL